MTGIVYCTIVTPGTRGPVVLVYRIGHRAPGPLMPGVTPQLTGYTYNTIDGSVHAHHGQNASKTTPLFL